MSRAGVHVFALYGGASLTVPTNSRGNGTTNPSSPTIDIPRGGVAFGIAVWFNGDITWDPLFDHGLVDPAPNNLLMSGASREFPSRADGQTITATWDAPSSGQAMSAAAFGPA